MRSGSKDDGHLLGTADADVVLDEGLEEAPRPAWVVEGDGAGDLDLAHRQLPEIAGPTVVIGEWRRDDSGPPGKEVFDVTRAEPVTDRLEGLRVLARGEAVRELAEAEALAPSLTLGPLVTVQPDLGRNMGSTCRS